MSFTSVVTNPARLAACALFGFLALGVVAAPAHSAHHRSADGTVQSSTVAPPATPSPNIFSWD